MIIAEALKQDDPVREKVPEEDIGDNEPKENDGEETKIVVPVEDPG